MTDRIRLSVNLADRPHGAFVAAPVVLDDLDESFDGGRVFSDPSHGAAAKVLAGHARFKGELGRSLFAPNGQDAAVFLSGRGPRDSAGMRTAAAAAVEAAPDGEEWSFVFPEQATPEERAAALEGLFLGLYRYTGGRNAPLRTPGACALVGAVTEEELRRARAVSEGVILTRDLVNTPAELLSPDDLADAAEDIAKRHDLPHVTWRGDQVLEEGFRLVDAVGRASSRPPTFTVIRHKLENRKPALALIGKGVVFDSGGLGIKPSGPMLLMRKDMGGAGTCLGVLEAVARLDLDLPLLVVIPAAENSIGPSAFRPGDVIRSHAGLTVEIGHTDAEGRLLLADAISYAKGEKPEKMLDVATLTGAARVALGPDVPALLGTDDELVNNLLASAERCDEGLWRLPLVEGYEKFIDTPWADVTNSATDRRGGAITAALFLRRFAKGTPWAHIDLGAWEDTGRPDSPKGANGMCVRTIVSALEEMAGS